MNRRPPFHHRRQPPPLVLGPPAAPPLVLVRPLLIDDLPDALDLSRACRPPGAAGPIEGHICPAARTCGVLAELMGLFAGYVLFVPAPGRLELVDLCVGRWARRRTVGTHLLRWVQGRLGHTGVGMPRTEVVAGVPETALDMQVFLAGHGFRAVPHEGGRHVEGGMLRLVYTLDSRGEGRRG